jgi:hypothetical protein
VKSAGFDAMNGNRMAAFPVDAVNSQKADVVSCGYVLLKESSQRLGHKGSDSCGNEGFG